jgi:hypothetical protein
MPKEEWFEYTPDHLLDCISWLLSYFGVRSDDRARETRIHHNRPSIYRARLIIGHVISRMDGLTYHHITINRNWAKRLKTCGIDPETLLIDNKDRFACAWSIVTQLPNHKMRFRIGEVENLFQSGFIPPMQRIGGRQNEYGGFTLRQDKLSEIEEKKVVEIRKNTLTYRLRTWRARMDSEGQNSA